MEAIIIDLGLIVFGLIVAFFGGSASIGSADGGPNYWRVFLTGIAIAILGGGLLAAKIIALIVRLWP